MLFYLNQFELHLPENLLKKGYLLFQKNDVHERDQHHHYQINKVKIALNIKNNQLNAFSCECEKPNYCEHLAAVLFYLQQNKLEFPKLQSVDFKNNRNATTLNQQQQLEQIIFKASIVKFSSLKKTPTTPNLFDEFSKLLVSNLKQLTPKVPINQNQIDDLVKHILHFNQIIKLNKQKTISFNWHLALSCFFIYLDEYRYSGNEIELIKIQNTVHQQLISSVNEAFGNWQKQCWLRASLLSIKSNKNIKSKVFYFLLPTYIHQTKNIVELQKIESAIKKAKYIKPYDESLNKLEVIKHMLHFKMFSTPNKVHFNTEHIIEAEYLMALCDYYLLKNKIQKTFDLIEKSIDYYLKKDHIHLRTFTVYAVEKSKYYQLHEKEIHFLRLSFIYNLHINDDELNRYKKIIPKQNWQAELILLIEKIKKYGGPFALEKITKLLLFNENHAELIKLLVHEKGKFKLLHDSIIKSGIVFDSKLMKVYVKELGANLHEAYTFARQKQIILNIQSVFDRILPNKLEEFYQLLIAETGYESQLGRFISNEMFPSQENQSS